MAITGIPDYDGRVAVEFSLRCLCGRRFVVFNPSGPVIGAAEDRAKERAAQMRATFVNACLSPWRYCEDCHQLLIFSPEFEPYESTAIH